MPIEGFCIAFDDPWDEPSPTWTRLDGTSGLVASWTSSRGRQDEFAKTGTGTATVELNDVDGIFDPNNAASDYFNKLDGRQAALALWNPVTEEWVVRFRGFVDGYLYDVDPSGVVTRMQVELVDGLDYLAGVEMVPGDAGHTPPAGNEGDIFFQDQEVDQRIDKILQDADWPLALSTVFSGNVEVKSCVYPPGSTALQALSDAADAEFPGVANIYVDAKGNVTFHGRHARFDPDGVAAGASPGAWDFTRWKIGDGAITSLDADYAQMRRLSYSRHRRQIINAALATPDRNEARDTDPGAGFTAEVPLDGDDILGQIVTDATSIAEFGVRSWSAENLLTRRKLGVVESPTNNDLTETKKFATYYVENFKDPQTRITQLGLRSIRPDDPRGPATWELLTRVEISDAILVNWKSDADGGFDDEEFFIEGITYDVRPLNGEYADITLSLDVTPSSHYTTDPFGDT